jgi:glucose-1-phosphate adenylyltransferase
MEGFVMKDVIGIINDARRDYNMKEIGYGRTMASIPFGGRYRMIDFALSNMINSDIKNVGILVQGHYRSLSSHIRSPKEWDLDRKKDGLFILPPGNDLGGSGNFGDLQVLYSNLDYIIRSRQKYVLISGVNTICNIDYSDALKFHIDNGNDITVLYKDVNEDINKFQSFVTLQVNEEGKITDMAVNPDERRGTIIAMGVHYSKTACLLNRHFYY